MRVHLSGVRIEHGDAAQTNKGLPIFEPLPRAGQLVLIGDFLAPLEALHAAVARYAAQGVEGHILLLLDPAELTLPFAGRIRFEGMEYEGSLIVRRTETLRAAYDDCQVIIGSGSTTLRAELPDQAAFFGLMERIRDFGLELLEVHSVPARLAEHPEEVRQPER